MNLSINLAQKIESTDAEINAAYIDAQRAFAPEASLHRVGGGVALYAGESSPVSRVVGLGFEALREEQLTELEAWYREKSCPLRIEVCPLGLASCVSLFAARGYRLLSFKNTWALPLASFVYERPETSLVVREIKASERELWAEVVGKGFAGREQDVSLDASIGRPTAYSNVTRCFLAFAGDEPIAGGSLAVVGDVGLVSSMSTRVAYRRLGAQSALLQERLRLARELGCAFVIAHTTPTNIHSQRNIERLGFRLLYTKITLGS